MGEVQRFLYVQPGLLLTEDEDDSLPGGYDFLRGFRISWDGYVIRYDFTIIQTHPNILMVFLYPDYIDQQDGISTRTQGQAQVQNNDIIGVASFNVFVGIAVATIFGGAFFFDLFWPERIETKAVRLWWKICAVTISIFTLAAALALTVRNHLSNLGRRTILTAS